MQPWRIEHHAQVSSTNTLALEFIRKHFDNDQTVPPTVVIADTQTAGRGQHDRTWHSPQGNMFATYILPDVAIAFRPLLPLYAGLAAWRTIRELTGLTPKLKWPNDLLLDGQKLAGLLVEAVAAGPNWAAAIGIGINVNATSFPKELNATSLAIATERQWDPRLIAMTVAHYLDVLEAPDSILGTYRQHDALLGQKMTVDTPAGRIIGTGDGIDDDGYLRIATSAGPQIISAGTVRLAESAAPKRSITKKKK